MAEWRKPTFDEAQVILREEKDRIRRKRSWAQFTMILLAILTAALLLLDDSTVREQSETLAVYVALLIAVEGTLGGLYLLYWMKTARDIRRYAKHQYEVTSGVCVRKVFQGGNYYYLTAFLEDESKQEAKVSREVYCQAEPYSQLLIVHLNSKKEWSTSFLRAFVIGPPISPAGKGSSVPKFMVGREEVDNSTYMAGFESLLPPAIDDPTQPCFMDDDVDDESIEADKIGKDLIGDEWKQGPSDGSADD